MRLQHYITEEDKDEMCFHCHKNKPLPNRTVCGKCAKELEDFRKKNKKEEK